MLWPEPPLLSNHITNKSTVLYIQPLEHVIAPLLLCQWQQKSEKLLMRRRRGRRKVYKEKVKRPDFKSSFAPFYINPSLENVLVRSRRTTVRENYRETEKAVLDAILGQVISDNHPARDRERQNYHQKYDTLLNSNVKFKQNVDYKSDQVVWIGIRQANKTFRTKQHR